MSNKPLILADNLFDDGVLHSTFVVTVTGTPVQGQEVWRLTDNLRDATSFTIAETNFALTITVDCGAAQSASVLMLDRGHNLAGQAIEIRGSTDNFAASDVLVKGSTVPASVGGLGSDANGCLTTDGVWWGSFGSASYRYWRLKVPAVAAFTPVLTGLYLGASYRFPEYLNGPAAYDYRTMHRVLKNEITRSGTRIKRGLRNYSEVDLSLELEETDFQALHPYVVRLLTVGHPWWFCLDDSTTEGSGLMRLFQVPGEIAYDPITVVTREIRLLLEEVAPRTVI